MTETLAPKEQDVRDAIERALDAMKFTITTIREREATGELATLKRLDWRQPHELAFARLVNSAAVSALLNQTQDKQELLSRLAVIATALAAANEAHAGWKLGVALADIKATPQRLGALLNARGETLLELVKRSAARLGKEGPLPYRQLGTLLLADLLDTDTAEKLRFEIARDFARGTRLPT